MRLAAVPVAALIVAGAAVHVLDEPTNPDLGPRPVHELTLAGKNRSPYIILVGNVTDPAEN